MSLNAVWRTCWDLAWQAYCEGSIPIGAAVADGEGRILSVGANRVFGSPVEGSRQIHGSRLAHAEVNAMLDADFSTTLARDCVLYTTVEPCPLCIGAMAMMGIKTLRYASRDPWAGSVDLLDATPYLRRKGIRVYGPECSLLEMASVALHIDFLLRKDRPRFEKVALAWEADFPEINAHSMAIFDKGLLPALRDAGETGDAVLRELGRALSSTAV